VSARAKDLTVKQEAFCQAYIASGRNATEAYLAAYNSKNRKVAAEEGCKLLDNPKITQRIRVFSERIAAKVVNLIAVDAAWVKAELVRVYRRALQIPLMNPSPEALAHLRDSRKVHSARSLGIPSPAVSPHEALEVCPPARSSAACWAVAHHHGKDDC
jgi:Terminase small subunit